jgi:hypothetical protein
MAWRYHSDDNRIEIIVARDFCGDLSALARSRPVWIVDTPRNGSRIDAIWAIGARPPDRASMSPAHFRVVAEAGPGSEPAYPRRSSRRNAAAHSSTPSR